MRKGNNNGLMLPAMRGKALHKYITEQVARVLVSAGFSVKAEFGIQLAGGRKDYVDLLVSRGAGEFVFEIETTPRHALKNAFMADELGLRLWIVTPSRKVSSAIIKKLKGVLNQEKSILFLT